MHVSEYIPIDPAVADRVLLRRLAGGSILLVFAFDEGDGPRVTAKVLVSESALSTLDAHAVDLREKRRHH